MGIITLYASECAMAAPALTFGREKKGGKRKFLGDGQKVQNEGQVLSSLTQLKFFGGKQGEQHSMGENAVSGSATVNVSFCFL